MSDRQATTRRRWLAQCAAAGGLGALAGCLGDDGDEETSPGSTGEDETDDGGLLPGDDEGDSDGTVASDAWPMRGGNHRGTGYLPAATVPQSDPDPAWEFDTEFEHDLDGFSRPPVVADGAVYVASGLGKVYAIDLQTGDTEWEAGPLFEEGTWPTAPLVLGETVYLSAGSLVALDRADGSVHWRNDGSDVEEFGHPMAYDGQVYAVATGEDPRLLRFDRDDGTAETVYSFDDSDGDLGLELAFADGLAVAVRDDATVGIDVESGSRIWRTEYDVGYENAPAGAVIEDGLVYNSMDVDGGSTVSTLEAVTVADGGYEWANDTRDDGTRLAVAVADGTVYHPLKTLETYDAETGERGWSAEFESIKRPVVGDGLVFLLGRGEVAALDVETGDEAWTLSDLGDELGPLEVTPTVDGLLVTLSTGVRCYRPA